MSWHVLIEVRVAQDHQVPAGVSSAVTSGLPEVKTSSRSGPLGKDDRRRNAIAGVTQLRKSLLGGGGEGAGAGNDGSAGGGSSSEAEEKELGATTLKKLEPRLRASGAVWIDALKGKYGGALRDLLEVRKDGNGGASPRMGLAGTATAPPASPAGVLARASSASTPNKLARVSSARTSSVVQPSSSSMSRLQRSPEHRDLLRCLQFPVLHPGGLIISNSIACNDPARWCLAETRGRAPGTNRRAGQRGHPAPPARRGFRRRRRRRRRGRTRKSR